MRERMKSVLYKFILLLGMTAPCPWQMDRYILIYISLLIIVQWGVDIIILFSLQYTVAYYYYIIAKR